MLAQCLRLGLESSVAREDRARIPFRGGRQSGRPIRRLRQNGGRSALGETLIRSAGFMGAGLLKIRAPAIILSPLRLSVSMHSCAFPRQQDWPYINFLADASSG